MSERKVLNKYYPPDFDVTKLPKLKLERDRQFVIRIMAPFSMRCKTCGDYIYKGRKFNSRMETIKNETYLGLRKYRFYIKCPKCLSEITFKTDPEKTDYEMEHGATRNFQAHRFASEEEERLKKEKEEEELNNPMKALENRTKESKLEMSRLEDLEDIKEINKRYAIIDHEALLKRHMQVEEELLAQQEAEDEALIQTVFGKNDDGYVKRISDSDSNDEDKEDNEQVSAGQKTSKRSATDVLTVDTEELQVKRSKAKQTTGRDSLTTSLACLKHMVRNKNSGTSSPQSKAPVVLPGTSKDKASVQNSRTLNTSTIKSSLTMLGTYDSSSDTSGDD